MNNITIAIIYVSAWITTTIAIIFGIKYTKSAWCLWALFLPACINISTKEDKGRRVRSIVDFK